MSMPVGGPDLDERPPPTETDSRLGRTAASCVTPLTGWAVALSGSALVLHGTPVAGIGLPLTFAAAGTAWLLVIDRAIRPVARPRSSLGRRAGALANRFPLSAALSLVAAGLFAASRLRAPGLVLLVAVVAMQTRLLPTTHPSLVWARRVVTRAPWALFLVGAGMPTAMRASWSVMALFGIGVAAGALAGNGDRRPSLVRDLAWNRFLEPTPSAGTAAFRRGRRGSVMAVTIIALAASFLFLVGVGRQVDRFNWMPENGHDQGSYLRYARDLHDAPDAIVHNRLEMPLYPYLVSLAPGIRGEYSGRLHAALRINEWIALIGIAGIAVWASRTAGWWAAVVAVGTIGFTMFLFLASWVLSDVLASLLFAACLGLMCSVLRRPSAIRGALFGAVAGLTQLTKAVALLPLVIAVLGCVVAFALPELARVPATRRWSYLAAGSAAIFLFVLVIAPYAANSDRTYGSPTYNRATTYYVWYDNYSELERGTLAAGDQNHRPTLPEDQIPSPAKYLRDHTVGQVADRFAAGWQMQWAIAMHGGAYEGYFGYGPSVLLLVAVSLAAAATNAERVRRRFARDRLALTALASILVALDVAVIWWLPFGSGNRFLLPILLPGVLICVWTIHRGFSIWSFRLRGRLLRADTAAFALLAVPIVATAVWNVAVGSGRTLGGY